MAKNRLKNALKKIGKAAAVAGAGYLAMKGLGGKGKNSTNADAIKKMTSNAAYNDDTMPGMLSKTAGKTGPAKFKYPQIAYGQQVMAKGGRAGKKSKPKSIGKALRGGGKVMR